MFGFNRNTLDITNSKNVLSVLTRIKPNYLVNCAGWTNVDSAEEFPNEARLVNAESLKRELRNLQTHSQKQKKG